MNGRWLTTALEDILGRLRAEERAQHAFERQADTAVKVAAYLREHPDASANAVYAAIGGRRSEVLRAVRDARSRFPSRGNHPREGVRS